MNTITVRQDLTPGQVDRILQGARDSGFELRKGIDGHFVSASRDLVERLTPEPLRPMLPPIDGRLEIGFVGRSRADSKDSLPGLKYVYDELKRIYKSV